MQAWNDFCKPLQSKYLLSGEGAKNPRNTLVLLCLPMDRFCRAALGETKNAHLADRGKNMEYQTATAHPPPLQIS
jgi:hypothetical protein